MYLTFVDICATCGTLWGGGISGCLYSGVRIALVLASCLVASHADVFRGACGRFPFTKKTRKFR